MHHDSSIQKALRNLHLRGRLIAAALCKRYIWAEVESMARSRGLPIEDVCGNIEPFEFLARFPATADSGLKALDFSQVREGGAYDVDGLAHYNAEPSVARFMGRLVVSSGARRVVELGCYTGWTSTHMALAWKLVGREGLLTCVDISQRYLDITRDNLDRLGVAASAEFVRGRSMDRAVHDALPAKADIIFIDSSHSYEETVDEVNFYAGRLEQDGMIVLHDSINSPGVRRAVYESRGRFSVLTFATERSNGLTVLQRVR